MKKADKSLSEDREIKKFVKLIEELDYEENLAYSFTANLIDFFADQYSGRESLDEKVMATLAAMFSSNNSYIRDRVERAIMKLMIKNYRIIRKYLLLKLNDKRLGKQSRKTIEELLHSAFSPIYFDYSQIADARDELRKMEEENNTEENQD